MQDRMRHSKKAVQRIYSINFHLEFTSQPAKKTDHTHGISNVLNFIYLFIFCLLWFQVAFGIGLIASVWPLCCYEYNHNWRFRLNFLGKISKNIMQFLWCNYENKIVWTSEEKKKEITVWQRSRLRSDYYRPQQSQEFEIDCMQQKPRVRKHCYELNEKWKIERSSENVINFVICVMYD